MSLHFEQLKTGAAFNRRTAKSNPMETLVQIIEADPTADNERLFRQWREAVEADDEQRDAALRYTFTNYMHALERDRQPKVVRKPISATARAEAVAQIKAKAEAIILLDIMMPNGKKARYCKGTEVAKFGGGWVKAGRKAGSKLLGDVFSEQQLRKLVG